MPNWTSTCSSLSILVIISTSIIVVSLVVGQISAKKIATLSGDQVVPPVKTNASGRATFKHPDSTTMNYKVNITGISHPSGIGVHEGRAGSNGDLIVDLMKHANNQTTDSGLIVTGSFTASDLVGQMQGKTILDLVSVMKSGDTYISVDTEKYPKGEIRGLIELANPSKSSETGVIHTDNQSNAGK